MGSFQDQLFMFAKETQLLLMFTMMANTESPFIDEEGTLWWHAHSGWSRATVHGPIVILPHRGKSYPFPKPYAEETIMLASWFNGDVKELIDIAMKTGADPKTSDAFTINGWPGSLYNCSNETIYRLNVEYAKTYLLRVVNAVMNEEMFFGIAGHNFTVVAQDGAYIKPIQTDYIMITPGQTMDLLLTANQTPSHYYMAASPCFDAVNSSFNNSTTTAILQYSGQDYTVPSFIPMPTLPAPDDSMAADDFMMMIMALATPEYPINVPLNITQRIFITVSLNQLPCPANAICQGPDGNRLSASFNNISFTTTTTDILQAYYRTLPNVYADDFPDQPPDYFNFTGDVGNYELFPKVGTKVKMIEYGAAVEIVFQGTNVGNPETHPIHLHGYSLYLVGTNYGNFNDTTSPQSFNLDDPPQLNTFDVPNNGWAVIRFFANNPGVWYMHCHLERHATWGMDTVLIVKNGPTRATSIKPPPPNLPSCS
ncbi:laccase-14-like isoform X2 [Rosa rugosa]|uniref:laccase-14-like isoform X2 n=1 Tax=Rosa rugosa TaxID=74645 RepID=UPI002B40226C|nr:laccase-14-like isoform X2 [Rosa rugosa]